MLGKMCIRCGVAEQLSSLCYCSDCKRNIARASSLYTKVCDKCFTEKPLKQFEIIGRNGRMWVRSSTCIGCDNPTEKPKLKTKLLQCDNHGRQFIPIQAVPVDTCKCGKPLYRVPENLRGLRLFRCKECIGVTKAPIQCEEAA
jgi:hypothetical protein